MTIPQSSLTKGAIAVALILAPLAAHAQTQVPGTPYTRSLTPHTYVPLSPPPLSFTSTDDGEATVTLPFPFKYYDTTYTQITVSTNGLLTLGPFQEITFTNQAPGSGALQGFIAPFWDDLALHSGTFIGTVVEGTEPNRNFVIEWNGPGQLGDSATHINFQIRLGEGPAGRIQIDYGPIVGTGWSASMGMEDPAGGRGIFFAASNCTTGCAATDYAPLVNQRLELIQDPGVELVATSISGPRFAFLGAQTPVRIGIANLHGAVIGPFGVRAIASTSSNLSNPVTIYTSSITLNPFQSTNTDVTAVFPTSLGEGLVYLGLIVDPANGVAEVNEGNNSITGTDTVRLLEGAPDLAITRIVTSVNAATAGDSVPISVAVTNVGGEPSGNVVVAVMLSTNPAVSPQDAELARYTVSLAPGATDARDLSVTIPVNANSGLFYLGLLADPENLIPELSESNNGLSTTTTIDVTGGPISIVTTELPAGYVRQSYVGLLNAVGGSATRNWTIIQGQLPSGLGLVAGTGEIYGRPAREESQTFTVQVESNNTTDTQVLTLEVTEPESPLTIVTRDLTVAIVGQAYQFSLVATGGTQSSTPTWTATGLPDGLTLSSNGVLEGTPTTAGDNTIAVTATDGVQTAMRDLVLKVRENPNLLIVPSPMPDATYGEPYSFQIETTGGIEPITFIIELGQLPAGLEMSATGLVSGTPMEVSDRPFRIVVEARDAAPGNAQAKDVNTFELKVNDVGGFKITTASLPDAYLNEGYTETIQADGGTPPYNWGVDGDLPPGLSATANATTNELLIAGQPSQLGLFTLTLTVVDSEGRSTARALAVRVIERPPMIAEPTDSGGCGCATTATSSDSFGYLAVFALGALLFTRRSRTRR